MAIIASDNGGGGDFTPVAAGTHFGLCDRVVDLGKQRTTYMGEDKIVHQVYIRWQIPAERVEWQDGDGHKQEGPAVIGKTYTLSLGTKANLRRDLESWRNRAFTDDELRGFDIAKLLGVPATISVSHTEKNGKTYANVASIGGLPKGMDKPQPEGELVLVDDEHSENVEKLSKKLREKYDSQLRVEPQPEPNDPDAWRNDPLDDDVPF